MNRKEIHLDLLRRLELSPESTQRELSKEMGVSLGKINYCMKKLIEKGLIKFTNFKNSENKASYAYFLTPKGIEEKGKLTVVFLKIKMREYKLLEEEIGKLKYDANKLKHNKK